MKTKTESRKLKAGARYRLISHFTAEEIEELVAGLYNVACYHLHQQHPTLTVPMARAAFERRLAIHRPDLAALIQRWTR